MIAVFAGFETPGVQVLYFTAPGRPCIPPPNVDREVLSPGRLGENLSRRSVRLGPWEERAQGVTGFGKRQSVSPRERIRIGGPHYDYNSGGDGSGHIVLFDFPTSELFGWTFSDADRLVVLIRPDARKRRDFDAADFDYAGMDAAFSSQFVSAPFIPDDTDLVPGDVCHMRIISKSKGRRPAGLAALLWLRGQDLDFATFRS